MLSSLQIQDLAIIDQLTLELAGGLTVLTGETGAGKSIVVDALQLLAGGRADATVVRHGAQRAEVAGSFELADPPPALKSWLQEHAYEGAELILRRVVGRDGRSRAFVNGQSVPLALLREAGELLIDIHGQHEFQSLTRASAQRELLDGYARHESLVAQVAQAFRAWQGLHSQVSTLESAARDRAARLELLSYQVQELNALALKDGEIAALNEERSRLSARAKLAAGASQALGLLYETEGASAHALLARALTAVKPLSQIDPKLAALLPMIEEAAIQTREAARELTHYGESLEMDPHRQDELERRLASIEELARKHRVSSEELPGRAAAAAAELASLEQAGTDLARAHQERAAALTRYQELAAALSTGRAQAAQAMGEDISARMQNLGMAGGCFVVQLAELAEPALYGRDQVELLVSANPGQPPRPLARVASGGELARLSLAVQVAAHAQETRCMVFDEVDSGIGGAIAEIVGRELRTLASRATRAQVLCVTHLPQVASQGHQHLRVIKLTDSHSEGPRTHAQLARLGDEERVEELARMLGGLKITAKALEHAREMLAVAATPERRRAKG